ncbi:MAG: hypothetical protein KI792_12355 [Alphaproteobacteria bacterium]|nr:hypothetical protein [Alphaproteobacteria bacterium SS10]
MEDETILVISESSAVGDEITGMLANGWFKCEFINATQQVPNHLNQALKTTEMPLIIDLELNNPVAKQLVRGILQATKLDRVIALAKDESQTSSLKTKGFVHVAAKPVRGHVLMTLIGECVGEEEEEA